MRRQLTSWVRFSALGLTVLLACFARFSESGSSKLADSTAIIPVDQKGQFVAAFDWSVDKSHDYTWPFESIHPAPYDSVWMVVERMPRAWPEKRAEKVSVQLSAHCCLQVNDRPLSKPPRVTDSQREFRVSLEQGRLRFSFSLPSGFRIDSRYALIRIKLYQVINRTTYRLHIHPTHQPLCRAEAEVIESSLLMDV